jgi:hypothetical protein
MALYPYARVAHLTGLEPAPYMTAGSYGHKSTTTPATLTGSARALYSYDLCIAFRDERGYWVHPDNNSATTNRHIRTVTAFLDANGYAPTSETRFLKRGMGHADGPYTLWAQEA